MFTEVKFCWFSSKKKVGNDIQDHGRNQKAGRSIQARGEQLAAQWGKAVGRPLGRKMTARCSGGVNQAVPPPPAVPSATSVVNNWKNENEIYT